MNARIINQANSRPRSVPFELGGRTYDLTLTLNALDEIQTEFGALENIDLEALGTLKRLFAILINEAVDDHNDENAEKWEHVDERYVGRKLTIDSINDAVDVIIRVFGVSLPDAPEAEGEITDEMREALAGLPDLEADAKN